MMRAQTAVFVLLTVALCSVIAFQQYILEQRYALVRSYYRQSLKCAQLNDRCTEALARCTDTMASAVPVLQIWVDRVVADAASDYLDGTSLQAIGGGEEDE